MKCDPDITFHFVVGRRGIAGTLLVHKIAGAAAEEGRSLAEVPIDTSPLHVSLAFMVSLTIFSVPLLPHRSPY